MKRALGITRGRGVGLGGAESERIFRRADHDTVEETEKHLLKHPESRASHSLFVLLIQYLVWPELECPISQILVEARLNTLGRITRLVW